MLVLLWTYYSCLYHPVASFYCTYGNEDTASHPYL